MQVCRRSDEFEPGIDRIIKERMRMQEALDAMPGVATWPSRANFILFRAEGRDGARIWQDLYDQGILVRDFSAGKDTPGCLRVSVGTPKQNDAFLEALRGMLE